MWLLCMEVFQKCRHLKCLLCWFCRQISKVFPTLVPHSKGLVHSSAKVKKTTQVSVHYSFAFLVLVASLKQFQSFDSHYFNLVRVFEGSFIFYTLQTDWLLGYYQTFKHRNDVLAESKPGYRSERCSFLILQLTDISSWLTGPCLGATDFWWILVCFFCLHGLTFMWWGCCGLYLWHKPIKLAYAF